MILLNNTDIHGYNTRRQHIYQPVVRTNSGLNSPMSMAITMFNSLPDNIKTIERLNMFKGKIRIFLTLSN